MDPAVKRQFSIRPYDPNRVRKPRSEAQERATSRAFTIARLRGLWYLAYVVSEPGRTQIRAVIDHELVKLDAEPQSDRHEREHAPFSSRIPF